MGGNHSHDVAHIRGHPFRREPCVNAGPETCGICNRAVGLRADAYVCERCPAFVLHYACFHYPRSTRLADHSLVLTPRDKAGVNADVRCSMCDEGFDRVTCAYVCSPDQHHDCRGGFRAHPRCANLPRSIGTTSHPHAQLVLRPRAPGAAVAGRQRRHCLDVDNPHQHRGAWSYECPDSSCVGVEICLASAMVGGLAPPPPSCCGCAGGGVVKIMGNATGVYLRGMVDGYTGVPFSSCFAARAK